MEKAKMNQIKHWKWPKLHSPSLYFQGWCRIQTPCDCTRHAINRGRSPRSTVVIVINATVSFKSVFILLAAKNYCIIAGTIANKAVFFLSEKHFLLKIRIICCHIHVMFIVLVKDFFPIFFHSYSERVGVHVFVPKFISLS